MIKTDDVGLVVWKSDQRTIQGTQEDSTKLAQRGYWHCQVGIHERPGGSWSHNLTLCTQNSLAPPKIVAGNVHAPKYDICHPQI